MMTPRVAPRAGTEPREQGRECKVAGRCVADSGGDYGPSVYVPLVHGIGGKSADQWASGSAGPLIKWWIESSGGEGIRELPCAAHCAHTQPHYHIRVALPGREATVLIDPIFWADGVRRPSRPKSFVLVVRAGLFLGLMDFVAATFRGLNEITSDETMATRPWSPVISAFRALVFVFGLISRAFIVMLLTMPAALAVLLVPQVHRTVGDALAWTAGDDSRQEILSYIQERTATNGFDSVVYVGHSQGGSIVATLADRLRGRRSIRVVTLRSGHALLGALNGVGRNWQLWRSLVLWLMLMIYLLGVGLVLGNALYVTLPPSVKF